MGAIHGAGDDDPFEAFDLIPSCKFLHRVFVSSLTIIKSQYKRN